MKQNKAVGNQWRARNDVYNGGVRNQYSRATREALIEIERWHVIAAPCMGGLAAGQRGMKQASSFAAWLDKCQARPGGGIMVTP